MVARVLAAALLVAGVASCGDSGPDRFVTVALSQGSSKLEIRAEVASTSDQRTRGLMGRASLADGNGMLFIYPTPVRIGFWMKDTLVPLDIAFISGGRVVEIRTLTPCRAEPCQTTTPATSYDWALEVGAGEFERAGILVGALVKTMSSLPEAE